MFEFLFLPNYSQNTMVLQKNRTQNVINKKKTAPDSLYPLSRIEVLFDKPRGNIIFTN